MRFGTPMLLSNFVKSSRLFLYLGYVLILLAIISLPAKVRVVVQPEIGETELYWYGPIFAVWIGAWSLPTLIIGVIESSAPKKAVWKFSLILFLANVVLALSIWDATRFWRGRFIQWLLAYGALLTPCIVTNVVGLLYLTKKEKLIETLKNPRIRILSVGILTTIPLLIVAALFYMWLATIFH